MTTFEQAVHIFRKDMRHLRWEIAGVLVLTLLLALTGAQSWEAVQERGGVDYDSEGPVSVMLLVAWTMLVARVIQTDAVPGDRQFWLTRPYSRVGLALSKALFLAAFIVAPFLLAQAAIVLWTGLPLFSYLGGLLWNQVLLTVLVLLPTAAVAALTRNLAQFLPAAIVTGGLLAVLVSDQPRSFGDREWIRSTLGFAIVLGVVGWVLWRQYRLRRSGYTALLALGATAAGLVLYLSFPRSVAYAIQSKLIGARDSRFEIRLAAAMGDQPAQMSGRTPNRYRQLLELPLKLEGAEVGEVKLETADVTFRTLSGIARHSSAKLERVKGQLVQRTSVDRKFYEAAKNAPVTVRAEYSVVRFARARVAEVPLDGTPVFLTGSGQCGVVASYDRPRFVCRSAFKPPQVVVSERLVRDEEFRWPPAVYSPFPSQLRFYPVMARSYQFNKADAEELAPATPERPAVLTVREPVAYFRYRLEKTNVRLADYAVQEKDEEEDER